MSTLHSDPGNVVELEHLKKSDVAFGFSDVDLHAWIAALRELPTRAVTDADVLAWVEGPLRQFFPFERFFGAYGNLSGGRIRMLSSVSIGHTQEFLASREIAFDLNSRSVTAWWIANRKPFILEKTGARNVAGQRCPVNERSLEEIERFSLGAIAVHGVIDPFANAGTHIFFHGVPKTQPRRTMALLDLIAPVLHTLYLQTKQVATSAVDLTALTDRQRDLMDLAAQGLSDKEIALRVGISHNTVGNHFSAIYARLGISKRSQLVAILK